VCIRARGRTSFDAWQRFGGGRQARRRTLLTSSDRGWSAGLKQEMRRRGRCQFRGRLRPGRSRVRRQRQNRRHGRHRSSDQLYQCADRTIRIERSVRMMAGSTLAQQIPAGIERRRPGRVRNEIVEMNVPERQCQLDCQREQRQTRAQMQPRSKPAHLSVFILYVCRDDPYVCRDDPYVCRDVDPYSPASRPAPRRYVGYSRNSITSRQGGAATYFVTSPRSASLASSDAGSR
jgi:hypothetical protein